MNGISGIKTSENITLISYKKIARDLSVLSEIFEGIAKCGVIIDMVSQTSPLGENVSISFSCSDEDMVKVLGVSNAIAASKPEFKPMVSSGNCKITLYGEEMRGEYGVFAHVLTCLSHISCELMQITTAETEISLLVPSAHLEDAIAVLKKAFSI